MRVNLLVFKSAFRMVDRLKSEFQTFHLSPSRVLVCREVFLTVYYPRGITIKTYMREKQNKDHLCAKEILADMSKRLTFPSRSQPIGLEHFRAI